ncbi:MAG: surface lipoprotein assembly modifier [Rhodocyclaceae bacterium]|nr:surface lipoprotein assembly modifier [Rhodocyclaceae bacterium]MDZ4214245.1 surface lipoprotein assembly modifier [Rhodocyclaceae bacterium]
MAYCIALNLVCATQFAHADALTDQASALLEQGKWQAAYELLATQESARAGDAEFDLLLGIAALETGKNTNAVFALERVLAVEPNNVRARTEIARAYFALGEIKTARKEFEFVNEQPLPGEAKINVGKFLAAIEQIESGDKTTVRGFVEFTVGYDTNVNAGPAGNQVAVPLFGGALFTLNATSVGLKDSFSNLAAGLTLRSPLTKGLDLIANLTGNARINSTYDIYDNSSADGNVGIAYRQDRDVFSLAYQLGSFHLDNNRFRDTSGFTGQWQRDFDARNQASLFVQHGWLRYPGQTLRDVDRTVVGLNAAHALPDRKTVFYGGLHVGKEDEINTGVPQVGNTLWGGRIGGQHQYRDDLAVFANLGYENRRYGGPDPLFLSKRNDDQSTLGMGVVWNAAPKWRVTSQYAHTRNSSNIPINTYTRDTLSVSARYSF